MERFKELEEALTTLNLNNQEEQYITLKLSPYLQEVVIEAIRPDAKKLLEWKHKENGKQEFIRYICSKFTYVPNQKTIEFLWNFYTKKQIAQRSSSLIEEFKRKNKKKKCAHCGITKGRFHVDHIVPLAKGGIDTMSNLQYLCKACNYRKSSRFDCKKTLF